VLDKIAAAELAVLLPKIYEIHPNPPRIVVLAIATFDSPQENSKPTRNGRKNTRGIIKLRYAWYYLI
jgi:hypothetical protein